ncbi:hypothetical protein [Streptantibioticus silvisoli]|uniref:Uncharacterized protein n=1 Tax=Streptantibioticus silvisoli TaxID=2705255 RepID=A0ABT6W4B2_9ACTN|nr:hypothetical protein [Streptantibioticus silvisoli]MDI5965595.1 hypothetical protein [Streptantibioticus silvisoli]
MGDQPHQEYARAVAGAFAGARHPARWNAAGAGPQEWAAVFEWRAGEPGADPAVWPHGVMLTWTQPAGWTAVDPDPDPSTAAFTLALPVDRLATPASLAVLLPLLLTGAFDDLPRAGARWQDPRAPELAHLLGLGPPADGLVTLFGGPLDGRVVDIGDAPARETPGGLVALPQDDSDAPDDVLYARDPTGTWRWVDGRG